MERVVFIEVLSRRGRVERRSKLSRFPATVGRAYSSDFIVDDKFVCPEHLRVSLGNNGDVHVEDLNSVNGMYIAEPPRRVSCASVLPEDEVRIGNTVLRFRSPEYTVASTAVNGGGTAAFSQVFENKRSAAGIVLGSFLLIVLSDYLDSYERMTTVKMLTGTIPLFVMFAVWTGIWAFINRIMANTFNFLSHLAVAGAAAAGSIAFMTLHEYYSFMLSPDSFRGVIQIAGFSLIPSFLIYGHLLIISTLSRMRCLVSSVLIALGILCLAGSMQYNDHADFSCGLEFASELKPVGERWLIESSADDFFGKTLDVKKAVDALAKETPAAGI